MAGFKSLVDKAKKKKDELAREAAKKAAKAAVRQGAEAALGAIDATGRAIEKAIFGDVMDGAAGKEKEGRGRASEPPSPAAPPDPFARLKAAEAAKRDEERAQTERAAQRARDERDIDDELAALKKRLGK